MPATVTIDIVTFLMMIGLYIYLMSLIIFRDQILKIMEKILTKYYLWQWRRKQKKESKDKK